MTQKKITPVGLDRHHYTADALILYCVDYRGEGALREFLFEKEFRHYDLIKIPGGAKALVGQSETEKAVILGYIETLINLHSAKRIILTTHIDCGACGGSSAFNGDTDEHQKHEGWLSAAKNLLSDMFPNIPIETYFVDYSGFWKTN